MNLSSGSTSTGLPRTPQDLLRALASSSEFPWLLMCAVALVVVIYLSLSDWQQVRMANEQSKRSDQSLQQLFKLRNALAVAEASQRGFLLTGRDAYLDPYIKGRAEIPADLAQVHRFALKTTPQQVRLVHLDHLMSTKLNEMQRTIDLQKSGRPQQSLDVIMTDVGQNVMDDIRSLMDAIIHAEVEQHHDTSNQVEHLAAVAGAASSLAVLSGLLLLTIAVWRIQREKAAVIDANEAKSRFLANMSHELRTPLNAIIGYSEMLSEEAQDAGQTAFLPDLARIRTAGRHLLDLINSVLDFSKIEAGKMELYLETFSIAKVVSDAEDVIKPLLARNGNKLSVDCPPDSGTMYSDETKLRQCLYNLLSNAAKFTAKGEIRLTVRRTPEQNGRVSFSIRDSGIGMSQEQIGRLFEPFTQGDSATMRRFGGTGLGLAITRRFCDLMKGTIQVHSTPGQGSTFIIDLPVSFGLSVEAGQSGLASTQITSETVVLAIDDEPSVHDLLRRSLFRHGFRVESAYSGEDGLRLARRIRPDVITLDVLMQGADGWAVLRALKSDAKVAQIPVVMLTVIDNRNHGFLLGANEYLCKPIDRAKLIEVLSRFRRHGSPGTALVIEDDFDARRIVSSALQAEGWKVEEAENGRIGLQSVERSSPTLILLDLMMPEMDGFEFVARLKDLPGKRAIPIVVLTAHELSAADRERLNGQVARVIRKQSLRVDELMAELRRVINSRIENSRVEPAPNTGAF